MDYDNRFKLYHLSDSFAWFTTYDPYEWCSGRKVGEKDPQIPLGKKDEFMRIAFDTPYGTFFSEANTTNTTRGIDTWLEAEDEVPLLKGKDITISQFCEVIIERGGELWFPIGKEEHGISIHR